METERTNALAEVRGVRELREALTGLNLPAVSEYPLTSEGAQAIAEAVFSQYAVQEEQHHGGLRRVVLYGPLTVDPSAVKRYPVPLGKCGSCGASIIWCTTSVGRRLMPVDADPAPGGTVVIGLRAGATPLAVVVGPDQRAERTDLHTSHFASCPQADQWRTRKASGQTASDTP